MCVCLVVFESGNAVRLDGDAEVFLDAGVFLKPFVACTVLGDPVVPVEEDNGTGSSPRKYWRVGRDWFSVALPEFDAAEGDARAPSARRATDIVQNALGRTRPGDFALEATAFHRTEADAPSRRDSRATISRPPAEFGRPATVDGHVRILALYQQVLSQDNGRRLCRAAQRDDSFPRRKTAAQGRLELSERRHTACALSPSEPALDRRDSS